MFDCHFRVIVDLNTHDNGEHLSAQLGQHFQDGVVHRVLCHRCPRPLHQGSRGHYDSGERDLDSISQARIGVRMMCAPMHITPDILDRLPMWALERLQVLLYVVQEKAMRADDDIHVQWYRL